MNISDKTIEELKADGFHIRIEGPKAEARKLYVLHWGKGVHKLLTAPKQKEVTVEWVMNKLNKQADYKNLTDRMRKLMNTEDLGLSAYPASYGIGMMTLSNNDKKRINKIKSALDKYGIEYKTEYSQAHWTYRFKLSKSKENIERIDSVV